MIKKIQEKFDINQLPKPAMIIDSSVIKDKFLDLQNLIEGVKVFYAVKTNSHVEIIRLLKSLGSGFEISSLQELRDMINLGIPADKIISGNTLKTSEFIAEAYKYGVNYFAYDSEDEVDKLAELAPGSIVSLRVTVDNTGSEWPLSKKFGAPISKSLELLKYALEKGLKPHSLTFHVGSQCLNSLAWSNALMNIAEVYFMAKRNGIQIEVINLGGGFPAKSTKEIPELSVIKENINKSIKELFSKENLNFYIEPGRGIVGEAGIIISSVIAKASRGFENWLILDVGVYNCLFDAIVGVKFEMVSQNELSSLNHKDDMIQYNIGGPTCDSVDTIVNNYYLPKNLKIGDIVYILNTGAYTIDLATRFNGFYPPKVYFI